MPLGRGTTWYIGQAPTDPLKKHPFDSDNYFMDFTLLCVGVETPNSVVSVEVHRLDWQNLDLTVGTGSIAPGTKSSQVQLSNGQDGITYRVTIVVMTTNGNKLTGVGMLKVTSDVP